MMLKLRQRPCNQAPTLTGPLMRLRPCSAWERRWQSSDTTDLNICILDIILEIQFSFIDDDTLTSPKHHEVLALIRKRWQLVIYVQPVPAVWFQHPSRLLQRRLNEAEAEDTSDINILRVSLPPTQLIRAGLKMSEHIWNTAALLLWWCYLLLLSRLSQFSLCDSNNLTSTRTLV